jgi:hypothetical protein
MCDRTRLKFENIFDEIFADIFGGKVTSADIRAVAKHNTIEEALLLVPEMTADQRKRFLAALKGRP